MSATTTDEAASWDPAGTYRPALPARVGRRALDRDRGSAPGAPREPHAGPGGSLSAYLPAVRSFLEDLTGEPRAAADLAKVTLRVAADIPELAGSPIRLPGLLELAAGLALQAAVATRRRGTEDEG